MQALLESLRTNFANPPYVRFTDDRQRTLARPKQCLTAARDQMRNMRTTDARIASSLLVIEDF